MSAGEQHHIRTLFEGEFFGEISLLEDKPSSAAVRAEPRVPRARAPFPTVRLTRPTVRLSRR